MVVLSTRGETRTTTSGAGLVKEHAVRYSKEHKQATRQRII